MLKVAWTPGLILYQRADTDNEIYRLDWSQWLDGEAMAYPPVLVASAGLAHSLHFVATSYIDVRITLTGDAGTVFTLDVQVESAVTARKKTMTFRFKIIG